VGAGGEMTQALYAHMNNKIKKRNVCLWIQEIKVSFRAISKALTFFCGF
jgi:hypothetical protein